MSSPTAKSGMFHRQFQLPGSPRSQLAVLVTLVICTLTLLLFEYDHLPSPPQAWVPTSLKKSEDLFDKYNLSRASLRDVKALRKWCSQPDEFASQYGRTNLRLSRGYEGSLARTHRLIGKAIRGEPISVAALGGSVTAGHHIDDSQTWVSLLRDWIDEKFPQASVKVANGAIPASGSDYFSFCMNLHIPEDADLVVVELGVNDEALPEHEENMENLLRGLLDMKNQPAVMLLEVVAFSQGEMAGGGYRKHLPIAQYYDVPVINQRHPLVTHWARFPEVLPRYFTENFWHEPDKRHMNERGHSDASRLIQSLLRDSICEAMDDPALALEPAVHDYPIERNEGESFDGLLRKAYPTEALELPRRWGADQRPWVSHVAEDKDTGIPESDEWFPGMWMPPTEMGKLPRLSALEKWNPHVDHRQRPWHPTCYSARSPDPKYNITPIANEGWTYWFHEAHKDKPFFVADAPGSRIEFELPTKVGLIKLYSLRSREYGLGNLKCWVEGREDKATTVEGYWDRSENIGRFSTIASDLPEGRHRVTCELLKESKDPGGGTNFRLISIMSV